MGDCQKTSGKNEKDSDYGGRRRKDVKGKLEECCLERVLRLSMSFGLPGRWKWFFRRAMGRFHVTPCVEDLHGVSVHCEVFSAAP